MGNWINQINSEFIFTVFFHPLMNEAIDDELEPKPFKDENWARFKISKEMQSIK